MKTNSEKIQDMVSTWISDLKDYNLSYIVELIEGFSKALNLPITDSEKQVVINNLKTNCLKEVDWRDYNFDNPRPDGVVSATLVDGTKVRLGIILEPSYGGRTRAKYAYVTEDCLRFSYGGFSGGSVGMGVELQNFCDYKDYSEKIFVGFVKI
jgi:hypothetical protein